MKVRESGMPAQDVWDAFFDVELILRRLQLDSTVLDLVEFGCGYGTFTLAAAKTIAGTVHTSDLDPEMLAAATRNAVNDELTNIHFELRDFVADGTGLADRSVDYAMLFNILHVEDPLLLLREARRNLTDGGLLGIVHWIHDEQTPRGPPLEIRPKPGQCYAWSIDAGLTPVSEILQLPPYHYGMVMRR